MLAQLRSQVRQRSHVSEESLVEAMVLLCAELAVDRKIVVEQARELVSACRNRKSAKSLLDSFLQEFGLSNAEGVALMCLAEALLRVPDPINKDRLIAEKVSEGDWLPHFGESESLLVNASTLGLLLGSKLVMLDSGITKKPTRKIKQLSAKLSKPVIRAAMLYAMKLMGGEYVLGRTIEEGIRGAAKKDSLDTLFSFDMLGEAARTAADAARYFKSYMDAIISIGESNFGKGVYASNGISIKLSALHERYHYSHEDIVMKELLPRIHALCVAAKKYDIGLSIDAEESERLDLSLSIFETLAKDDQLTDWQGLGFVLQAYQKRAPTVVQWLIELARQTNRKIMVRLVKGAYWDSEIKHAQEQGLVDYPVFTRKANTDLCYEHCASLLLDAQQQIYPQFATHNAHTVSMITHLAADRTFEFQRLYGMGELLYRQFALSQSSHAIAPVRVYAPIGMHQDLLPYLVRRLLENGANSSFVNQFLESEVSPQQLVQDALQRAKQFDQYRHSQIPTPSLLFERAGERRANSIGLDLDSEIDVQRLVYEAMKVSAHKHRVGPIINGVVCGSGDKSILNPATSRPIGSYREVDDEDIINALELADANQGGWKDRGSQARAEILRATADLLEAQRDELVGLIALEAGRTLADGVSEVREAVDFCRYYALQAEQVLADDDLHACGTFFCISPWNFPLAIFVGQIAAALSAGNAVLAKPAAQTPAIAARAVGLFHQAGVPVSVLHLLIGNGPKIGELLLADSRLGGVCFTGSTDTAQAIHRQIANRPGATIPFIAETGGQNCMLVDSTALPEQVVEDVIASAFHSAGQRCSALRVLFLQEEIADRVMLMLKGATQSITLGDPFEISSDLGPVIDRASFNKLMDHVQRMQDICRSSFSTKASDSLDKGVFFEPRVFEIDNLCQLDGEVFGPILHVIRYQSKDLDDVIEQINNTGFGLTLGIHSRIAAFADYVFENTRVGNTYINRNMIGSVVGVNPFGGQGLSGTGPKAGGPNYLLRFCRPCLVEDSKQTPNPAPHLELGEVTDVKQLLGHARTAFTALKGLSAGQRADVLRKASDCCEEQTEVLLGFQKLTQLIEQRLTRAIRMPGPTGEENLLSLHSKGVVINIASSTAQALGIQMGLTFAAGCPQIVICDKNMAEIIQPIISMLEASGMCAQSIQLATPKSLKSLLLSDEICAVTAPEGEMDYAELKALLAKRSGAITPLLELPATLSDCSLNVIYSYITYLLTEKTRTENLVARGGNTQLFNLAE